MEHKKPWAARAVSWVRSALLQLVNDYHAYLRCGHMNGTPQQDNHEMSETPIIISPYQLAAEYQANEVAADAKYKGKLISLTGIVQDIRKDFLNTPYVVMATMDILSGIQCGFDKQDESALAQLSKGDRITVICRCTGEIVGGVVLKDCVLQAEKPIQNPVPPASSQPQGEGTDNQYSGRSAPLTTNTPTEIDTIAGRLSIYTIADSGGEGIKLNSKIIFQNDSIAFNNLIHLDSSDVVLANFHCTGNAAWCADNHYFFIVLDKTGKVTIFKGYKGEDYTNDNFIGYSDSRGIMAIRKGDAIEVDLGLHDGKQKKAILANNQLSISYAPPLSITVRIVLQIALSGDMPPILIGDSASKLIIPNILNLEGPLRMATGLI